MVKYVLFVVPVCSTQQGRAVRTRSNKGVVLFLITLFVRVLCVRERVCVLCKSMVEGGILLPLHYYYIYKLVVHRVKGD